MPLLAERPAEVATPTVPGHWEGDLIKGARTGSAVGTVRERISRLVSVAQLEGPDAQRACDGFTTTLRHVPAALRKTVPSERGKEQAEPEQLAQRLARPVVVADPQRPWQRGTNEQTHGLLRQERPKGTDLSPYTPRELNAMAQRVNTRPRTCLDWATPLEVFSQLRQYSPVARGT